MSPFRANPRRSAFTLMEMVTSCVILSMLMLSLGYGLKLAIVSTGNGATQSFQSLEGSELVGRVADDLNEAMNFTEKTSQAVTFTVPDRTGDNQPESIRYAWWPTAGTVVIPAEEGGVGGVVGGLLGGLLGVVTGGNGLIDTVITVPQYTLTKQLNGGPPAVLGRDVRQFSLDYLYRTMAPATSAATDQLLWQHDPIVGIPKDFPLDSNKWIAETFVPQLPGGTTSWSITRIFLYVKADSIWDGTMRVSVRAANASTNFPTSTTLDSTMVSEVSLNDSYSWVEVPFTNLNNLSPSTKYSILIEGMTGTGVKWGEASWLQVSLPASTTWVIQTTNKGAIWSTPTNLNSLRYKIYGTTNP
jgi:hypothetical protein